MLLQQAVHRAKKPSSPIESVLRFIYAMDSAFVKVIITVAAFFPAAYVPSFSH
jgi:hypothetical protein